ncbi:MAG: hypothetical protein COV67_01065, partial [Nitrospinae bacterium CG11_big_fil_rev_8_21_14_0_20_56_8]
LAERLRQSTFNAFHNIVKLALKERVDAVIIAGDIFDSADRSLQAQLKFRRGLQELSDAEIPSFIAFGNHDPLDGWSASLEWPERVHFFSGKEIERRPLWREGRVFADIYGRSFPTREVRDNLALQFQVSPSPAYSVAVLHTNVGNDVNHDNYAPCALEDLVSRRVDYWALGHVHQHRVLRAADPAVVYSGNSQARHPREGGKKGCCLVTLQKGSSPQIRFVPIDDIRFHWENLDLSGVDSRDDILRAARNRCELLGEQSDGRDIVLRLSLTGRTRLHSDLNKGGELQAIEEEIQRDFDLTDPRIWIEMDLQTAGTYDVDSLRKGKDFIADIVSLYDAALTGEHRDELREVLKPLFESWQGRGYLEAVSDDELQDLLVQARALTLDLMVPEK